MYRGPTAHALARYRCFLPDLAGLAGLRRVGPGTCLMITSARPEAAKAGSVFEPVLGRESAKIEV